MPAQTRIIHFYVCLGAAGGKECEVIMYKFGFIGMGNMASAIAQGFVESGFIPGKEICAYDLNKAQLEKMSSFGIVALNGAHEVVKESDFVFLCVKPQVIESVVADIKDDLKGKAVVSIVLGYDYDKYNTLLDASTRHLTVMPNTPMAVREGMCLLEQTHSLNDKEFNTIKDAFSSVGEIEVVPNHLMGVGGALSGCAPAYIYMVIEALADGAVMQGMPRKMAYKLASQTVLGSGKMQLKTDLHPGILKDNVTSPGGSTIRGVKALEDAGMRSAFINAIEKSMNR